MLFSLVYQVINLLNHVSIVAVQSTCGPKVSARLLMDIPCDMSKTGYCDVSGVAYPWAAVRRYIYENQGLLKRMYGDQRHYQIVTNEIQDLKDKYENIYLYDKGKYFSKQPQFRPRSMAMDEEDIEEDLLRDKESSEIKNRSIPEIARNHNESLNYNQALPLEEPTTRSSLKSNSEGETTTEENERETSTSDAFFTSDYETTEKTSTISKSQSNILRSKDLSPATTEVSPLSSTSASSDALSSLSSQQTVSSFPIDFFSSSSTKSHTEETSSFTSPSQTSTSPSPALTISNTNQSELPSEKNVPKKGINACPVREEVIAPYWANNTRGEILALLNVYPFEQYVHWEKCAYENKQMFCRQGCRCEQQYRLHRLLAFDPKNECRGIFADWFRFPSCCVCICYDLPESNILHRVNNRRKGRL